MKDPKKFWDARYGEAAYAYGIEPNRFFREQLSRLKPGKILLPAEGEGRNAVFAARQGWEVSAFDWSDAGRRKAQALAEAQGMVIDYQVATAEDVAYQAAAFDALALIFANFAVPGRKTVHQKLLSYLKSGGYVIFESYSKDQLEYQRKYDSGGPKVAEMLFSAEEISTEFAGLTLEMLETVEVVLEEGPYHAGPASIIHFIGRKAI